ncbi:MAG TPA: HTH-type transcriptional regulator CysB [Burkholderiales bacterium]|nr:HTH-type transcriptional regulator CysB [Burkholderiales bacterium]
MKLQQLRYLCEVVRQNLNVSGAAQKLHTSQPGISKQIRLLEEELGVQIFVRNGKRVVEMTPPGKVIHSIAQQILQETDNLKRVGEEFTNEATGSLKIATTHTQARYALPPAISKFTDRYPKVKLSLHQGSPTQIAQYVASGEADIAIATEAIELFKDLVMLPCYQWNRCVVTRPDHPLLKQRLLTLEELAKYPIITYDFAFAGRSKINGAFAARRLTPNVVLTAIDSDVIKHYVELGLGVGILAKMAFDPEHDKNLRAIDASHLFESSTTRIGIRRGAYLRGYVYDFIELFAPHLTRKAVAAAMSENKGSDYQL